MYNPIKIKAVEQINLDIWASDVINFWSNQKLGLEGGISTGTIEKTEKYIDFLFPQSFKELYKKANGFKDWGINEHFFSIWPINKIIEEFNYARHPEFIGFCDFLINSHWIGFVRGQEGIFKRWDCSSEPPIKIAESFEEVIKMINDNSDEIY